MSTDWESEGLLEGLVGGRDRQARRRLLDELAEDGVSLAELRRAVAEQRLVLVPLERALASDGEALTLGQAAERAGVDRSLAEAQARVAGIPFGDGDTAAVFTDGEVETLRRMQALLDAGLERDDVLAIARVISLSMGRIAETIRTVIGERLLQPGDTEYDLARRYAAAAASLRPLIGPTLDHSLTFSLRETIRDDVLGHAELSSGRFADGKIAICFADLVGFTKLGERLEPDQLGNVATRLSELTSDAISRPTRLVKELGDGVMVVGPSPAALVDLSLRLIAAGDDDEDPLPPVHAGVAAGTALERGGDWYGAPVNLASRLCDTARPGSVLVSETVQEALGEGYQWSFAGARKLKGITEPVKAFRARSLGK